jgi:hypothetical protein
MLHQLIELSKLDVELAKSMWLERKVPRKIVTREKKILAILEKADARISKVCRDYNLGEI